MSDDRSTGRMSWPGGTAPAFHQRVTAVNGFAYGVVNADIHVFANGEPLYLLANWRRGPDADRNWLRQMPSRLLNAHRAVVPFTGRDEELAELRQWRDTGPRLGVRWLHGPGGQGKTRLAAQLAAESLAAGWKVAVAFHGPDADQPEPGSEDMRLDGAAGLLLVVDYADRWLLSNLTWLFKNAMLHQVGVAARVLMIGRSLDAWPAVCGILDSHQADTTAQRLPDLPGDDGRSTMFATARNRFAAIYRYLEPESIPPPRLNGSEFGLTLAVHMAALVAVDAAAAGERPPRGMDGLSRYLLNRERLHWHRLHHDGATGTGSTYRTPTDVMNRTVFTAALTGTLKRPVGVALLDRLGIGPDAGQILIDHAVCYPVAESGGSTVLEPLYPDRLTEDFLALTMPGHRIDYPQPDWAAPTATAVLTEHDRDQQVDPILARSITFLAAATDRWPHLGQEYLYPLLLRRPDLAIDAGGAALNMVATSRHVPVDILEALEARIPAGQHIEFDIPAATIVSKLTRHRLDRTSDPVEQARLHTTHSIRLIHAGRVLDALAPAEEAVAIDRRLAEADPDANLPNLAVSLNNLGTVLSALGRWNQALEPTEESVQIDRRLAETAPDTYLASLASSLNNLGLRLGKLGRYREALDPAEEAVVVGRRLAEAHPDIHLPSLAMALQNLSVALSAVGRPKQALEPADEAVTIQRRLAESMPDTHLPSLAGSLSNVGNRLSTLGRHEQALGPTEESVALYRRLAKANPDSYLSALARALNAFGYHLAALGRHEEALGPAEESVTIRRQLAAAIPDAYLPDLAKSLAGLTDRRWSLGRRQRTLDAIEEAVAIDRRLAAAYPDAYLPDLAIALSKLGVARSDLGKLEQAVGPTQESVSICRRLAAANPDAYLPGLAGSLNNLSLRLTALGRHEEALEPIEEAVAIQRRLADDSPDSQLPTLALLLTNLGKCLSLLGRHDQASGPTQEALVINRGLVAKNPDAYLPELTRTLTIAANQLADRDLPAQALDPAGEAVAINRRLAEANPVAYLPNLATSLNTFALLHSDLGQRDEALTAAEEVVSIYRQLAASTPAAHLPDLAAALSSHATVCLNLRTDLPAAFTSIDEAIDLYTRLTEQHRREVYDERLYWAYHTLADVLEGLGHTDEAARMRQRLDAMAGIDHPGPV